MQHTALSPQKLAHYQGPAPRYTSYPSVPHWNADTFHAADWPQQVQQAYTLYGDAGLSLYIHLPYCESLCTYCGCNTHITVNHGVEDPYITAVLKEWSHYRALFEHAPTLRELHLGGGTPTFFSPASLQRLMEGILKLVHPHPELEMSLEAHPANTTAEHLRVLYDLGFRRLSLGIQDFDPQVQQHINRYQSVEQVQAVVDTARQIGFTSINFDLLYGLPGQNEASLRDTFDRALAMQPDRLAFYGYAHVPWIKPAQKSFETHLPGATDRQALYTLGTELCRRAGYLDIGMDHFALPHDTLAEAIEEGSLHRNFMGYTTQATRMLIGLGASAISDIWHGFAQNAKAIKPYLEQVQAGQLPIQQGHRHTPRDLVIRQHILNLMCHYQSPWLHNRQGVEGEVWQQAQERLLDMQADGLLRVSNIGLEITRAGRPYLRPICKALDLHFWEKQAEKIRFSQAV